MIRPLKIVLVAWGVIHTLLGLSFIFLPNQISIVMGFGKLDSTSLYIGGICGATFIAASISLIVAARDLLHNILWAKFALGWAGLGIVVQLYLIVTGAADINLVAFGLIQDMVFTVLLLAFYPFKKAGRG